jgi:hypothetical protein
VSRKNGALSCPPSPASCARHTRCCGVCCWCCRCWGCLAVCSSLHCGSGPSFIKRPPGQLEPGRPVRPVRGSHEVAACCWAAHLHSSAQLSTAQVRAAQFSSAQHSTAQLSTTQPSSAQLSSEQHSTAQLSSAQKSTAQLSSAQHSTAQHSTAQLATPQSKSACCCCCCCRSSLTLESLLPTVLASLMSKVSKTKALAGREGWLVQQGTERCGDADCIS